MQGSRTLLIGLPHRLLGDTITRARTQTQNTLAHRHTKHTRTYCTQDTQAYHTRTDIPGILYTPCSPQARHRVQAQRYLKTNTHSIGRHNTLTYSYNTNVRAYTQVPKTLVHVLITRCDKHMETHKRRKVPSPCPEAYLRTSMQQSRIMVHSTYHTKYIYILVPPRACLKSLPAAPPCRTGLPSLPKDGAGSAPGRP